MNIRIHKNQPVIHPAAIQSGEKMNNLFRKNTGIITFFLFISLITFFNTFSVQAGSRFTNFLDPDTYSSGGFGTTVTVLKNGNVVITDPYSNDGIKGDTGAVYLYNGSTGSLISRLVSNSGDSNIGSGGVIELANGNYVILSPQWRNEQGKQVGAITWGNQNVGVGGIVSANNSLVGASEGDEVGSYRCITLLSNGNYVVSTTAWSNGIGLYRAGAATWGSGTSGVKGVVSSTNSLVGTKSGDGVGSRVVALSNGNYVTTTNGWDNGASIDVGASTWGDGMKGVTGVISSANSLIGGLDDDSIGIEVIEVGESNYLVISEHWSDSRGAVTWGDGKRGVRGIVTSSNSLVGSAVGDTTGPIGNVSNNSVRILKNKNYLVLRPYWDNENVSNAGAITWGNGNSGVVGITSQSNSLIGSTQDDLVGDVPIVELTDGNYVVACPKWNSASQVDAGAAVWGNGGIGVKGIISATNALVGSSTGDKVASDGVVALANGNYVVSSKLWANSTGAATWGSGVGGISGIVSNTNSLVGYGCGSGGIVALVNGNYVVCTPSWDFPGSTGTFYERVGAATWGNGTTGISGPITSLNSLVGSTKGNNVATQAVPLKNGNYVVVSPQWDENEVSNVGAVTWGDGAYGTVGIVSSSNSLVGSSRLDAVGTKVVPLTNGNYVVRSDYWDNGTVSDAGAVTWASGFASSGLIVSVSNSLIGVEKDDLAGIGGIYCLANGNYLVFSPFAGPGGGATTWGSGTSGVNGVVSAENSLIGGSFANGVEVELSNVTELTNGNYVLRRSSWSNGTVSNAGAVTWASGTAGVNGVISSSNSLVGSTLNDNIGKLDRDYGSASGVIALPNGNYLVQSDFWDNGSKANAGAVTWCSGTEGLTGNVNTSNSMTSQYAGTWGSWKTTRMDDPDIDVVNGHFIVSFREENYDGVVRLGSIFNGFSADVPQHAEISVFDDDLLFIDSGSSVGFGNIIVGNSKTLRFTVKNAGTANLTALALEMSGTDSGFYTINATNMPTTLTPGNSIFFTVTFIPGAITGTRNATIHIACNDEDENPFTIGLVGTGVALAPVVIVEQPPDTPLASGAGVVSFGNVVLGGSVELNFTIRNSGTAELTGITANIGGVGASQFILT